MRFIKGIAKHPTGRIGLVIVLLMALVALGAKWITPYDPYDLFDRDMPRLASGDTCGTDHVATTYSRS